MRPRFLAHANVTALMYFEPVTMNCTRFVAPFNDLVEVHVGSFSPNRNSA